MVDNNSSTFLKKAFSRKIMMCIGLAYLLVIIYWFETAPINLALYAIFFDLVTISIYLFAMQINDEYFTWKLAAGLLAIIVMLHWKFIAFMPSLNLIEAANTFIENKTDYRIGSSYQELDYYNSLNIEILATENQIPVLFGPANNGKTYFLKQLARKYDGILYHDMNCNDADHSDSFGSLINQIFFPIPYSPLLALHGLYLYRDKINIDFTYFQNLFNSEYASNYFLKQFGRKPVFIFDRMDELKGSEKELKMIWEFAEQSLSNGHYKVIFGASENWSFEEIFKIFDKRKLKNFHIPLLTEEESYRFQKQLRPNDTENIIQDVYKYTKGEIYLHGRFTYIMGDHFDESLNEKYANAIKKLILEANFYFRFNDGFRFHFIYYWPSSAESSVTDKELKAVQLVYWLIKNEGPLLAKNVVECIAPELENFRFFKIFENERNELLVDFKTNIHRIYAIARMGFMNIDGISAYSFNSIVNKLSECCNFTFKEVNQIK